MIGYVLATRSLADPTVDVLLGGGAVGAAGSAEEKDRNPVFVFEPGATVDVKLAPVLRIGIGAGYRFVGDVDVAGLVEEDLHGFAGVMSARIGRF